MRTITALPGYLLTTRRAGIFFLGLVVMCAAWGFVFEPASLHNENHDLQIAAWPRACDGFRIAVLSDLHVGSPFNGLQKLERIVTLTLAAKPDLILLTGDYVIHRIIGGRFTEPEEIAKVLRRLPQSAPVYAVLGNHDWWYDGPRIRSTFESVGIRVLDDESAIVERRTCSFSLVGISDFWVAPHDVEKALSDVPEPAAVVAFTHNPDVFPEIPAQVALTIAGHTHGGQVYIPGVGRPITGSRYGQRYAVGHIVELDRHLFVSPGLGTSILPVRFLVPPEVSVLRLYSANRKA